MGLTLTVERDCSLRTAAGYELVPFNRLPAAERQRLNRFEEDIRFFGVLRSRLPGRYPSKVIDRDLALLLYSLREPGPLPGFAHGLGSERLAQLVADGVLEMAEGDEFVSGAAGLSLLTPPLRTDDRGHLARLSQAAVRYGAALDLDDTALLAARLYAYHRVPLSPRWRRFFPNTAAVRRHLGIDTGPLSRRLAGWKAYDHEDPCDWLAWFRPGSMSDLQANKAVYKLYVSPHLKDLPAVIEELVEALERRPSSCFKVGANALSLLRPDKLVAYFGHLDELLATAERLTTRLAGLAVHGVPFTAEVGAEGLLSWGLDPSSSADTFLGSREGESWRGWVTRRLASFLCMAGRGTSELPAWRFALERLRLEGVDIQSWTPSLVLWREI